MEIEQIEEKLANMHFDNIVKSYCNKVNDIERLKAENKELNEQLRLHFVGGSLPLPKCECGQNTLPYKAQIEIDKCSRCENDR